MAQETRKGTPNRRMLKAIQTLLERKVLKDAQQYEIKGRNITRYSFEELRKLEAEYQRRCLNETRKNHFGEITFIQ